jgi:hypothetical protein
VVGWEEGEQVIKDLESTQRFLSAHAAVYNTFNVTDLASNAANLPCRSIRPMEHRRRRRLNT